MAVRTYNNGSQPVGRSFKNGKGRRYAIRMAVKLSNGKMQLLNNGSLGFDPEDITNPACHCNAVQAEVIKFLVTQAKEKGEEVWSPVQIGPMTFFVSVIALHPQEETPEEGITWGGA